MMRSRWTAVAATAAAWAFSLWAYPRLPERVPSHWGVRGEVDGWSSAFVAAFVVPAIATATLALIVVLRRVDPRRENYARFEDEFWRIVNAVALLLAGVQGAVLGAALGWPVPMPGAVLVGVGLLLMLIGNYLPRVRSNFWMGIRTPWTLSSEAVWRETHRVGGRIFVAGGAVVAVAGLLPARVQAYVGIPAVVVVSVVPIVHSYLLWRRERAGDAA